MKQEMYNVHIIFLGGVSFEEIISYITCGVTPFELLCVQKER